MLDQRFELGPEPLGPADVIVVLRLSDLVLEVAEPGLDRGARPVVEHVVAAMVGGHALGKIEAMDFLARPCKQALDVAEIPSGRAAAPTEHAVFHDPAIAELREQRRPVGVRDEGRRGLRQWRADEAEALGEKSDMLFPAERPSASPGRPGRRACRSRWA